MPRTIPHDTPPSADDRFAIVVSSYNEVITRKLLEGALSTLTAGGVEDGAIDVVWTPGAFEIPLVAAKLAHGGAHAAVICLGAVIKGETKHDEHINRSVSHFLAETSVASGVPVLFGVLTCDSLEQAIHRAGGNKGNKGAEAAAAALHMVGLLKNLNQET